MGRAGAGDVMFERAAGRGDIGVPSGRRQRRRQFDGAALGPARYEARDDLQYRRRAALPRAGLLTEEAWCYRRRPLGLPQARDDCARIPVAPRWPDDRLSPGAGRAARNRLSRWPALRHDRRQGALSRRILPKPWAGLCALRLFRPWPVERRVCPRHGRPLGRGCDRGPRRADPRAADPGRLQHRRLDHAARGTRPAPAHPRPRRHRRRTGRDRRFTMAAPRRGAAQHTADYRLGHLALRIRPGRLYLQLRPDRGRQAASA